MSKDIMLPQTSMKDTPTPKYYICRVNIFDIFKIYIICIEMIISKFVICRSYKCVVFLSLFNFHVIIIIIMQITFYKQMIMTY